MSKIIPYEYCNCDDIEKIIYLFDHKRVNSIEEAIDRLPFTEVKYDDADPRKETHIYDPDKFNDEEENTESVDIDLSQFK